MSLALVHRIWRESKTRGPARAVLLCLAIRAKDADRRAWPSIATIAKDAGISERTAQYAIRDLEEAGEIRRTGIVTLTAPNGFKRYVPAYQVFPTTGE